MAAPKRKGSAKPRKATPATMPDAPPTLPPPWTITNDAVLRSKLKSANAIPIAFSLQTPPPGVLPKGNDGMAMDSAITELNGWAASQVMQGAWFNGVVALPMTLLAEMAQRPEYRRISEVLATEMTRKWIRLKSTSTDDQSKTEKIKQLDDELARLNARDAFRKLAEMDGLFGRAHLYIDTGQTGQDEELKSSIGDGRNAETALKFKGQRGFLKALRPIEPVWCYPANYNANNPLKGDWYNPQSWFCLSKELHGTRLLTLIGREVPDLLKSAYMFGGLSLTQMVKPYVDNWLRTRQAVADLIWSFSVRGLKTNLATALGDNGAELFKRAALFANLQSNQGLMVMDKDTEDFFNIATPLGSLDALQAQSLEHLASVSATPVVKLLGIQPAGLNASSQGELTTWYDRVAAFQEAFFRDPLQRVVDFAMLSLWGERDPEIVFEFEQLEELTEIEEANKRKVEADTDVALIGAGVLDPHDARKRLAADPGSPYDGLDVDEMPAGPLDDVGDDDETLLPLIGERDGERRTGRNDDSGRREERARGRDRGSRPREPREIN